jgi:hypothetical protein
MAGLAYDNMFTSLVSQTAFLHNKSSNNYAHFEPMQPLGKLSAYHCLIAFLRPFLCSMYDIITVTLLYSFFNENQS